MKVEGDEAQGPAVWLRSLSRPLQNSLKDLPHRPLVRPLFVLDQRQEGQRAIAVCVCACVRVCPISDKQAILPQQRTCLTQVTGARRLT